MSESRLRELLADLVAGVDAPPMAQPAWRAAQRSRRRRVAAGAAAAAVLAVGAGIAVAADGPARITPGPIGSTPSTVSPAPPRVQAGPDRAAVAKLPALPTRFAALSQLPAAAPTLSGGPASRVVAAVQAANGSVLVLGHDGDWRQVAGGPGASLFSTSISPDARRLVLAPPEGLVLIDATTGDRRPLPVPPGIGRVDGLVWLPDGDRIAVSGDGGAAIVSTTDGGYRATGDPVFDLAVSRAGGTAAYVTASELVVQDGGTTERRRYETGDLRLDEWYGGGWVDGSLVARTGFLDDGEQATFVVDVATARVTHVLTLPSGAGPALRSQGCCATLGWLDRGTVLLRDGGDVLAWRLTSGAVDRVARLPEAATRPADSPYEPVIALA